MPRKEYQSRLSNTDILKLFREGKYWVDLSEGVVYSERTACPVFCYEGNTEGHYFVRLYSQPFHRTLPLSHVIWMFGTKTELPDQWHIHHIDRNVQNNSFNNLVALHPIDHRKIHANDVVDEIPF